MSDSTGSSVEYVGRVAQQTLHDYITKIEELTAAHDRLRKENAALREALELAVEHLDWIGWGGSWERECVRDSGDMAKINAALQGAKDD